MKDNFIDLTGTAENVIAGLVFEYILENKGAERSKIVEHFIDSLEGEGEDESLIEEDVDAALDTLKDKGYITTNRGRLVLTKIGRENKDEILKEFAGGVEALLDAEEGLETRIQEIGAEDDRGAWGRTGRRLDS
jgi:hypothetical protein